MTVPQPLDKIGDLARRTRASGFSGLLFTETGATARRIRPDPVDQAQGRLPRRGHLGTGRPLEFMIYGLVRRELPDTVFVSVTHRTTVNRHHEQHLDLLGEGRWWFGPVESAYATM